MNKPSNNGNGNKFANIIMDVRFIVFVVGIVLATVFFITNADTKINERLIHIEDTLNQIENNHLMHIQQGIDENAEQIQKNQDAIIELLLQVKELQVEHININSSL